jgi:hypothetical protein
LEQDIEIATPNVHLVIVVPWIEKVEESLQQKLSGVIKERIGVAYQHPVDQEYVAIILIVMHH